MRELKFRAWDKENEEYMNGYDVLLKYDGSVISRYALAVFDTDMPVNVIIEQYTGLKDKNGREIYEGDIIQEEIDFNSKMTDGVFTYVVEWDSDTLCYGLRGNSNSIHDELWEVNASVEIIGNVHENPELLGDTNVANKEEE